MEKIDQNENLRIIFTQQRALQFSLSFLNIRYRKHPSNLKYNANSKLMN